MIKLAKYFKPFIASLIAAVLLLMVQAYGELSLPDYMSDIVNIGIQQNGIENAVPEYIREKEYDKLLIFMTNDEKVFVNDNYGISKNYTTSVGDDVYQLMDVKKKDIDKLNDIMKIPILIVNNIESGGLYSLSNSEDTMPISDSLTDVDPFEIIFMMPEDILEGVRSSTQKQTSSLPSNVISQVVSNYIKAEYTAIGIDIENLQNRYIFKAGSVMIGFALVIMLVVIFETLIASRVAAGVATQLRRLVFNKVTHFSNAEFDKFSTASLITRTTNDIQQIQDMIVLLLRIVIYSPILALGGIFKVLNTESSMSWIIALAVAIIIAVVVVLFTIVVPKFEKVQTFVDKVNLVMRESLSGLLVIRAFGTQHHEESKFYKANDDLTKTNLFIGRLMSLMMPIMMFVMNGVSLLIIWIGAGKVDSGSLQVGDMMAFIQYSMQIIMSFLMISMISIMLPRATVSANRIVEVLETKSSILDPTEENIKQFDEAKKGYVEFKNVSFRYPDAEDYVIENINFIAKPGETTAFIGSTGSGKSSAVNLIPRFYDVTEGQILLDGVDIRNVSQHDLRNKIGYIPQKGILFSGTIESNIKFADSDISDEDMMKAAEISQSKEFISDMPQSFHSPISQGGTNVSGGQKQRLSIARAIAKKPDVFIFDDSFSALDFKTDAVLRKAINAELSNTTMLIVAQRISTIKNASQILVFNEGKVVGCGKHYDLLESCDIYRQIALSQLSKEELFNEQ